MCSPGQTEHIPHSNIPGFVDPVHILGVKIPEAASIEACAIDVQKFHESLWGNIVKLLQEGVDLANELAALCHTVLLHAVVRLQDVAQVLTHLHF